jgi:surface antigen
MKQLTALLLVCSAFLLMSCANTGLSKGQQGAIGGGAAGAIIGQAIGHNTGGTLIGAAVGTMLGYIVGNEMDKYDRQQLSHVYERGVSGSPSAWVNPDSGNQYQVTPKPAYNGSNQQVCRQAEIMAVIDGRQERTLSTACRDSQGNWILQ